MQPDDPTTPSTEMIRYQMEAKTAALRELVDKVMLETRERKAGRASFQDKVMAMSAPVTDDLRQRIEAIEAQLSRQKLPCGCCSACPAHGPEDFRGTPPHPAIPHPPAGER